MKDIITVELPNFKANYEVVWYENTDFSSLKNVKQVYGVLLNEKKEVLIIDTGRNWQLPGGTPKQGESWEQTLIREVKEEASVEIENIIPLGYQMVSEIKNQKKGAPLCQLRFAAKIKKLNKIERDPSTGNMPKRNFIDPKDFLIYCPWGKIGQHVIDKAVKIYTG